MEPENLPFIHDYFFKESMKHVVIARGFSQQFLPERVSFKINYNALEIAKDSWINTRFILHSSDILYRTEIQNTEQLIFLLFEHKSYIDNSVALQNYQNTSEVIEEERIQQKSNSVKLAPVIPIIVYHGNDPWNPENSINTMFEVINGTEPFLPHQGNVFIDLNTIPDEQIKGIAEVRAFIMSLKYSRSPLLFEKIHEIISAFNGVGADRLKYLEVVIRYLKYASKKSDRVELAKVVEKELELGDEYMKKSSNIWAELGYDAGKDDGLKEGEDIGLKKGKDIGFKEGEDIGFKKGIQFEKENEEKRKEEAVKHDKKETAIKMLKKQISIKDVCDFTGLTINELIVLRNKIDNKEL